LEPSHRDVLIVGAGLSGIGAGYHLQTQCPDKTYAILEARQNLGGTWDLFRYPGVRSDSDMYTLGYSFRPWKSPFAIADGASILAYIRETAEAYGIDRRIRYGLRVDHARWSTRDGRWTVEVRDVASGATRELTCRFLYVCAGYYDYERGYTPDFAGVDRFTGRVVHPQGWTPDVAYEGKRVVVVGSGATAFTLVPQLAKRAAHVTMLQRSPTYVVAAPSRDPVTDWTLERMPEDAAYAVARWRSVLRGMAFYAFCQHRPEQAKRLLVGAARKLLTSDDAIAHFTPTYKPWDQRVCLAPDGDLFKALRRGTASMVTDHIDSFVESGILLRSGKVLEADLIVTATGLRLKFLGGVTIEVDGRRVTPPETMTYRGMMFSDVPNLAFALGYTNASWTLKCDLTSEYVCRLLNYMERRGYVQCTPRRNDPSVKAVPLLTFSSGYIQRSLAEFPRQGSVAPWRLYQNYALDRVVLRHAPLRDGSMEFASAPATASAAAASTA
jgi:cation diffusion facilitator CzcD-associated flavoprotein CzcO